MKLDLGEPLFCRKDIWDRLGCHCMRGLTIMVEDYVRATLAPFQWDGPSIGPYASLLNDLTILR